MNKTPKTKNHYANIDWQWHDDDAKCPANRAVRQQLPHPRESMVCIMMVYQKKLHKNNNLNMNNIITDVLKVLSTFI